jgi:uncharacterized membrane protein
MSDGISPGAVSGEPLMEPVAAIAIWSSLFVGIHLLISSQGVRPRLIKVIGAQPYRGVYSLAAIATLTAMIIVFAHHKHAGAMFWYLRDSGPARLLTWLLMFAALIILTAGIIKPSPSSMVASAESSSSGAHGVLKLTRHPAFVAFSLFGFAHMLMNGWAGDLIFFGAFPALGILGGRHQDRRKLRDLGENYRRFVESTSFFPGAALISRRQRWTMSDMPWAAIGIAAAVGVVLVLFHPYLFGGSPIR